MRKESLIDKKEIAKEILSFFLGLLSTATRFFLALYFNNNLENEKDLATYQNIKKAFLQRLSKQRTIDSSFKRFLNGILFNELNTNASSGQLTNNNFLKFADPILSLLFKTTFEFAIFAINKRSS